MKLCNEIINPYVVVTRKKLKLPDTHRALIIWDVFKGQMTDKVKNELAWLSIELVPVPANMTHFFQPLDLTVNRAAKNFIKKEFVSYYSGAIQQGLNEGKALEDIQVDVRLTVIKPLHAQWLVDVYNFFSTEGQQITIKGWKKAGILGLFDGTVTLPPNNPFEDIFN